MLLNSANGIRLERVLRFLVAVGIALALLGSDIAYAGEPLDPVMLLQRIKTKGAETVYNKELTGATWLAFLKKVETGERLWLEVAVAIYPATDGGPAEALTLAAGEALVRAPHEVLLLVSPKMGIEGVCDYSEMTMGYRKVNTRQQVVADIDTRINAVRRLSGSDVVPLQSKCLKILENAKREMLGPNGSFPSK